MKCLSERVSVGRSIALSSRPACSFRSLVFTSHTMSPHPLNSIPHISPDILLTAMQNVVLSPSPGTDTASSDDSPPPFRPFLSYTHAQILFLYKSPLVSPPKGMPLLKDWFGYVIPYIPFSSLPYISLQRLNEPNSSKKEFRFFSRHPRTQR